MLADDDRLDFLDEEPALAHAVQPAVRAPWRILIVDDDEDVHQATVFALRDAKILGCGLEFLHAYNSVSALELLRRTSNIAVILLDVVMETEDAGLAMIGKIRGELAMSSTRIILRTGQPGYAPDIDAITRYDINDYKTKAELNRSRLFTALTAAIRSYDQITRLDASRRGLELIVDSANQFIAEQGLPTFATRVIEQTAALLHVPVAGVIATRRNPFPDDEYVILAAAGRRRSLLEGGATAADVECVDGVVREVLRTRRLRVAGDHVAVYFAGKNGRDFVAFVETPRVTPSVDEHLLGVYCANVAICADNIELVSRLRETAYVDGLTSLPNRTAMIEAMENKMFGEADHPWSVALVDIDQFSETIDILGYRYGDQMLLQLAHRLRGSLPTDVYVARVGGDVFGIFGVPDVVNPAVLREILNDPLIIEDGTQMLSLSLGFVNVGEDMQSGADLLRYAAIALKRAKATGVGREFFYTPEVAIETRERVRLLQDLRLAYNGNELFVVYQPQVDIATGRTIGVEALMRWRTPAGEMIPPDRFIPVAEQSGLIVGMGALVLRSSLRALRELTDAGFPMRMAVNVSAVQFRHPSFLDVVDQALNEIGAAPELLELEITESVAMFGQADFEDRLRTLKLRGLSIAIDDFGTGFSSLSYLDRLSADCLKIDRSFVWALNSDQPGGRIAELVIGLGRRMGMRVLAEGVETAEQAATLHGLGCHEAQGWHYGKPMTQNDLLAWLRKQEN